MKERSKLGSKTLRELLPARQFEVAGLVRYGFNNPEIARMLGISRHAVQMHLHRMLELSGCDNRLTLAVRYALENQEVELRNAA